MQPPLKILILEDNPSDVLLLEHELNKSGMNFCSQIVQNRAQYEEALINFKADVILSDHSLPAFNGTQAFALKQKISPDTPFIIVSGTIGDENAVELIKSGVTDYALKGKLFFLPQKIDRALKDLEKAREKLITDKNLYKAKNLYAFISQVNQNIVRVKDEATLFLNSCHLAIDFGRFKMSWVGLFDFENKTISLVEQYGIPVEDEGLFTNYSYQSNDPQDFVLRNGEYFICNDIQKHPGLQTLKPYALKRGLNSCIVLPIKKSGNIIGTFNLYSTEHNFSGVDEIKLLVEVTNDISFALDIFEKDKKQKQAEKQIIKNEKRRVFDKNNLNALINNTKDLMWSVDTDYNLITSNKPFDEMAQFSFGKLIEKGSSLMSISFSKEVLKDFKKLYERVFRGESFTEERYFDQPIQLWSEISYCPIYKENKVIGAACFSRDITERKKSEIKIRETENKYRLLVEQASDAIVVIGEDGTIMEANTSCANLFGYSKKELMYMVLDDLLMPEDLQTNKTWLNRLDVGQKIVYQKTFKRSDDSLVDTEISARKTEEGKTIGIIRDISERKRTEIEREKMLSNIIQHSKNLEQFAQIISHNLRAPVANILGISNVLRNNISTVDRERSLKFLFGATEQLDSIIKDLNNILQVRSEINEYKEVVYLDELVGSIKSSIHHAVEKETVQIVTDFSALEKLTTIKSYIHSVFFNLISNSIKYRQAGKIPKIEIKSGIVNEKIIITFKDNGLGIDLDKHGDKIFGLYKRFHLNTEGKGLGLFMVKTQIETLSGNIMVESLQGEGATFIIELPLSPVEMN